MLQLQVVDKYATHFSKQLQDILDKGSVLWLAKGTPAVKMIAVSNNSQLQEIYATTEKENAVISQMCTWLWFCNARCLVATCDAYFWAHSGSLYAFLNIQTSSVKPMPHSAEYSAQPFGRTFCWNEKARKFQLLAINLTFGCSRRFCN